MNGLIRSLLAVVILGCLAASACGPDASEERAKRVSPQSRHAVHSNALQSIMSNIGQDMNQNWPQEIAQLKQQQSGPRRFEEIAEAADRLASAAHGIPQAVPDTLLSGPDRQQFLHLVAQLESRARALSDKAAQHDSMAVDSALEQVRATCNGCHNQFREVAGTLPQ